MTPLHPRSSRPCIFTLGKKGLKPVHHPQQPSCRCLKRVTGCYYLRTRAAVDAIKFTVDASAAGAPVQAFNAAFVNLKM
jgi:hypothetical protein